MIYDKIDGHNNRRVVFITLDDNGDVFSSTVSKDPIITEKTGHIFIVDDYVAEQITKFKVINGKLELIEGEELTVPVKSEKELMIEELQRQMAELQAMPDEPTDEPTPQ